MHIMMVSTTIFLEKTSYHPEGNFSILAKNYNLQMRKNTNDYVFGNPLAVKPRKVNISIRISNGK